MSWHDEAVENRNVGCLPLECPNRASMRPAEVASLVQPHHSAAQTMICDSKRGNLGVLPESLGECEGKVFPV